MQLISPSALIPMKVMIIVMMMKRYVTHSRLQRILSGENCTRLKLRISNQNKHLISLKVGADWKEHEQHFTLIHFLKFYWMFLSFKWINWMNNFYPIARRKTTSIDDDDDNDSSKKNVLTKVKVKSLLSYLFIRLHQTFQWNSARFRTIPCDFSRKCDGNEWFIAIEKKTQIFLSAAKKFDQ